MKKPNKKDFKYRLLGFFFYWRTYKKDLQLYNDLLHYNPPKLKKKDVKNLIDVKHVKPEIDVRKEKFWNVVEDWVEKLFSSEPEKQKGTFPWYEEVKEKRMSSSLMEQASDMEDLMRQSVGVPSSYEGRFEESRRSGKTTRQVDEVIQKLFERRGERVSIIFQSIPEARHFEQILKTRMRQEHGIVIEVSSSNSHHNHRPGHFITLTVREKRVPTQNYVVEEAVQCIIGKGGYTKKDFCSEESARYFYREVSDSLRLRFGHDRCYYHLYREDPYYRLELKAY